MSERLTDAQVAALTRVDWDLEGYRVVGPESGIMGAFVTHDDIQGLALEVQQSRQRRCGNCAHWERLADQAVGVRMGMGWCGEGHEHYCGWTKESWFCADFQPK